ncbi:MAG TPA: hypothetical protein DER68_06105 [Ruminococcaceae bacterium]|nr:hypothetical protein [Oscillospiraceae bacterium]
MNNLSSLSDIYKCVVENCVNEYDISGAARELWLDPLVPLRMDGNTFVLATDHEFKKETLKSLYLPHIEEQLKNILGVPMRVEIVVDDKINSQKQVISELINAEPVNDVANIDKKVTYTFDNFIVGPSNNLAFAAAKAVSKKQHEKYNPLFIYGDSGLGKTHLSLAIAARIIERDFCAVYISAPELIRNVDNEQFGRASGDTLSVIADCDLLILDDLGAENNNERSASLLYEVINGRISRSLPIIVSTNYSINELHTRYNDRILSRLLSMNVRFFEGNDNRLSKIR